MEEYKKENQEGITEAEINEIVIEEEKVEEEELKPKKKNKTDFYIELALFLILGILIGIAIKTEATKKITIGFNDYKMKIMKQDYDINKLQADLTKQSQADVTAGEQEVNSQEGQESQPQGEEDQNLNQ